MGRYTEIIISGLRKEEDVKTINKYLEGRDYHKLKHLNKGEVLPDAYYGEYKYLNPYDVVEFLEKMDWKDCIPEEYVRLFVMEDEEFNFSEYKLNIPDQNWKNFGSDWSGEDWSKCSQNWARIWNEGVGSGCLSRSKNG